MTYCISYLMHSRSDHPSASSYKFHRLFPLSQYDLPSHNPNIFAFAQPLRPYPRGHTVQNSASSPDLPHATRGNPDEGYIESLSAVEITQEKIRLNNPDVDYTRYSDIICCLRW